MQKSLKPRTPAWHPVDYTSRMVYAVQALAAGTAAADQQREALDWIINTVAGTYEISFRSESDGGDRETAYAEGRRFVGLQLVKLINMTPQMKAALRNKENG